MTLHSVQVDIDITGRNYNVICYQRLALATIQYLTARASPRTASTDESNTKLTIDFRPFSSASPRMNGHLQAKQAVITPDDLVQVDGTVND